MGDTGKIARKLFDAVVSGDVATIQSLQAEDIVVLDQDPVGLERNRAGRRDRLAGGDMKGAEMHAAFDDVAIEQAVRTQSC